MYKLLLFFYYLRTFSSFLGLTLEIYHPFLFYSIDGSKLYYSNIWISMYCVYSILY